VTLATRSWDTSSLIAVVNTDQWNVLAESSALTNTDVCRHELQNHVTSNAHAPEGSREQYLKRGRQRVLEHADDDSSSWSRVTVVPRPYGPDAGEKSLKQERSENGDSYQVVSLLNVPRAGRSANTFSA